MNENTDFTQQPIAPVPPLFAAEEPAPVPQEAVDGQPAPVPGEAATLPQMVTLSDFATAYWSTYGAAMIGAFVAMKESAGELTGNEQSWLRDIEALRNRPVAASRF